MQYFMISVHCLVKVQLIIGVAFRYFVSLNSPRPQEHELESQDEGSLAAEVSMICLDSLELIIQVSKNRDKIY